MQPHAPFPAPSPGAFGPPPGALRQPFFGPAGPPLEIRPEGRGGFGFKWCAVLGYLCVAAGALALMASSSQRSLLHGDDPTLVIAVCACGLGVLLWILGAFGWIYASWDFLPPAYRRNAAGRSFTPLGAVAWQLVPIYNLYWVFAQNLGYCEAIDGVMIQTGRTARAPKTLATVACVLQVVPWLNFLAAPLAWMAYMFAMDAVKSQLLAPRR